MFLDLLTVDKEIHNDALVRCWMGLGLVDEYDIQRSCGKLYSLIGDLKAACLLESCGDGGHCVKCMMWFVIWLSGSLVSAVRTKTSGLFVHELAQSSPQQLSLGNLEQS